MSEKKDDIRLLIDRDEGLKSKRKMLTITSLILLAIQFSGAKVVEANTFILKLDFKHQEGIALLLFVAVCFLMIRYFNYARQYNERLYSVWTKRMLRNDFFISYCTYSDDVDGLIIDLVPKDMNLHDLQHDERCSWEYKYISKWPLRRYIEFYWFDENHDHSSSISLFKNTTLRHYLKILRLDFLHRITSFFTHRENLDIVGPYILGASAITSYILDDKIQQLITYFS